MYNLIGRVSCHPHPTSKRHAPVVFLDATPPLPHNAKVTRQAVVVSVLFVCLSVPSGASAASKTSSKSHHAAKTVHDVEYISALAAANRFMNAWQTRDHETIMLMLSDAAKHQATTEHMNEFLSADATDRAFEIGQGKQLKPDQYAFTVGLFSTTPGAKHIHSRYSQVMVVRTSAHDWAIDKLP